MLSSSSSLNSSMSEVLPPLATPSPPSPLSPTQSPLNAGSDPPMPSNSSNPSPPPKSPPSTPSAAPPLAVSPPPPLLSSLPPALSPPPPSLPSSPPASPPAPSIHSVPPVSAPPPSARNSPPTSASPPPPVPIVSPPSSSPPPLDSPVLPSPPSPPSSVTSPSPPLAEPPKSSPHAPKIPSPAPSGSKLAPPPSPISHPKPSSPTPTNHSQPISPSSPGNSSILATPSTPPLSSSTPTRNLSPPISPKPANSSNSYADVNIGSGSLASPGARSDGIKTGNAVVIAIVVGLVLLLFVLALWWCVKKKNKRATGFNGGYVIPTPLGSSQRSDTSYSKPPSWAPLLRNVSSSSGLLYSPRQSSGLGNSRSWFTYEELLEVTNGFSKQNLLGEGGFGSVYKGRLPDGREVAVKQLKVGGSQGEREFRAEVEIIGRVHHRHLVSLVGYCISEHQRLLVYDYVPNNTLDYHLHGEGKPVMDWAARLHVAVGAARGIAYLHEDCHPRIIHRDIKSSNILLDNNFEAQVSDFGLAKLALDSFTHVSTRVMGTFGYVAPEYASSGKLTEKSDVYSFGVVLLELITGRKPVDASQPMGDESLVEWARPLLSQALENGVFEGLVDSRLERNYLESEMFRMIEVAAACVRHSAMRRPRMGQVVRVLECTDESDLNNGMKPGQSKLIDSAAQPVDIRMLQRIAFGSQEYSDDSRESRWRPERNL